MIIEINFWPFFLNRDNSNFLLCTTFCLCTFCSSTKELIQTDSFFLFKTIEKLASLASKFSFNSQKILQEKIHDRLPYGLTKLFIYDYYYFFNPSY